MLDGRLEEQLQAWAQIKADEVPKINELIKQADVPALTVAEAAKPSPAATRGNNAGLRGLTGRFAHACRFAITHELASRELA